MKSVCCGNRRAMLVLLLASLTLADAAFAWSCAATPGPWPDRKDWNWIRDRQVPELMARSEQVFIGRLVGTEFAFFAGYYRWTIATFEVERAIRGAPGPRVQVIINSGPLPGARMAVFARTDDVKARNDHMREGWHLLAPPDRAKPRPVLPPLAADGLCERSAFPLDASSLAQEMLSAIGALPPAGSGGRASLSVGLHESGDPGAWRRIRIGLVDKPAHDSALTIRGPAQAVRVDLDWNNPFVPGDPDGVFLGPWPEGRYRMIWPKIDGHRTECLAPWANCEQLPIIDRGHTDLRVRYLPDARLAITVLDATGKEIDTLAGLVFTRLGSLPKTPFQLPRSHLVHAGRIAGFAFGFPPGRYAVELVQASKARQGAQIFEPIEVDAVARLPLPDMSKVELQAGENHLVVRLPPELQPVRVNLSIANCGSSTRVAPSPISSMTPGKASSINGMGLEFEVKAPQCSGGFSALPGQAWQLLIHPEGRAIQSHIVHVGTAGSQVNYPSLD